MIRSLKIKNLYTISFLVSILLSCNSFNTAAQITTNTEENISQADSFCSYGNKLLKNKNTDSSLIFFNNALQIYEQLSHFTGIAASYNFIGDYYFSGVGGELDSSVLSVTVIWNQLIH